MSDINNFFKDGFILGEKLPELLTKVYSAHAKNDSYVDDGHGTCWIASWESDLPSQNENVPEIYLNIMDIVLQQSPIANWYQTRFGKFSRKNVMLQKSSEGHTMDWHFDGYDPMHLVCLIYLTEEEWTPEDGGQLLIGEADCDDYAMVLNQSNVRKIAEISPNPGTVVRTLNTNPRQVHKVKPITCRKDRYALIGQFGYKENAENTNVKQWMPNWS